MLSPPLALSEVEGWRTKHLSSIARDIPCAFVILSEAKNLSPIARDIPCAFVILSEAKNLSHLAAPLFLPAT